MVPTSTDDVVTETMSRGVSHKAVALLDKRSDERTLQRVNGYVAAVCAEAGVLVTMDVPELKRPWLEENLSDLSQIAGVALMNGLKDLPVCDTDLGSVTIVKYFGEIAHQPKWKTSFSNLEISGKPAGFQPLAIRTGLPRKEQILLTDPIAGVVCLLNLSKDVQTLSVS